jgi:hypothetical protein
MEAVMIAGIYNITCEQGSTLTRTFRVQNPDETVYNLQGYHARMQIRRDVDSETILFTATSNPSAGIQISTTFGEISLTMTATQTAAIQRSGYYDLEIYNSSGIVYKVVKGKFNLAKEATR